MMGVSEVVLETTTILIIEDGQELREDVAEMLNIEGYTTHTAENGAVGVRKAKELLPDLIVCDIMMPELDGFGVLKALRADTTTSSIPFIFLTAKTEHVDQRYGFKLGADDFLKKPFIPRELLESIETQLRKRREQLAAVQMRILQLTENIATALPHELRTPLNTIIGFSEMLQSEAENLKPDQITSWSKHIHDASYRLYRLVENYLYYVRSQVLVNDEVPSAPDDEMYGIQMTIEMQAMTIAQKLRRDNDLIVQLEEAPIIAIEHTDGTKIVDELLDNAFKFSTEGQTVTVRGYNEDGYYVMEIEDQGRGMSREQINHIGGFMQFDRWLHEQQGMGLGLAVVKLLTEIYGAEFEPISEVGKGTIMRVRFKTK